MKMITEIQAGTLANVTIAFKWPQGEDCSDLALCAVGTMGQGSRWLCWITNE